MDFHFIGLTGLVQRTKWVTNRYRVIFHMLRRLTKVDAIYICFLLFYNIELYINNILRSCTFIICSI